MIRKPLLVLLMALLALPSVFGCSSGPEFPGGLFGLVFEDSNANGAQDDGEPGIKGVLVSNGVCSRLTNDSGEYNLSAEGALVFVTTPSDYTPTGQWYASISSGNMDFGLRYAPEKDTADFTFVQMTDIHLAQEETDEFGAVVAELNELGPAFVVATGDLIDEGNGATVAQAGRWFDLYENVTSALTMPLHNAVGNHDVVGIHRQDVPATDPGYGEGIFISRFGPTYYSFDWGEHHCIVLDPNDIVDGKQLYQISDSQLQWLRDDLKHRSRAPLLIFYHEPTASWRNRRAFVDALKGRSARLFCGHLHQDITTDATDISEQITGAVSGEWWYGPNPDGQPAGYRIISVKGGQVDSLYKGTGHERTIDLGLAPVINGEIELAVKIHSVHGSISEATYRVDDGQPLSLTLDSRYPWTVASASWDTTSLSEGYHRIEIGVLDANGSFEKQAQVKVSQNMAVSPSDLASHWSTYQGSYVAIEGTVDFVLIGPSFLGIPEGVGFVFVSDGVDRAVVVAGECFSPPLDDYKPLEKHGIEEDDRVTVKAVPLRLSMAFLTTTREYGEYYSQVQGYVGYLPSSAQEKDAQGRGMAVWGARWLSADDLTFLAD